MTPFVRSGGTRAHARRAPRAVRDLLLAAALALAVPAHAQEGASPPPPDSIVHVSAAPVQGTAGAPAEARVHIAVSKGWHINANPPNPDYMIATVVELQPGRGVKPGRTRYPAARQERLQFDPHPLAVYTGQIDARVALAIAPDAPAGTQRLHGTVRFQSCNDQVCLAPATVAFDVDVSVTAVPHVKGAAPAPPTGASGARAPEAGAATSAGATAQTTPAATQAQARTAAPPPPPPAAPTAASDPYTNRLVGGGWMAFVWLFLWGLALNLTPCVYPMLGVTVSIFGAKRAVKTPLVVLNAAVYVLGMATMYTTLGVVAALSGAVFGSLLQSAPVLIGIALVLVAMSLSMFGLYELNPPPQLLTALGGASATNLVGMYLSGLVVGVFAAPCVGPVVVSLLTIVAARGDVGFGLRTFLTLSLGLGAPYLVLGTFSNLLQKLPRSGEWMVWMKKLFGVVTLAVGANYALLALAPRLTEWVMPAALVLGGVYLGFIDRTGKGVTFRRLKWAVGAAGAIAGVAIVMNAPAESITFRPFDEHAYQAALASGHPVILDFSAQWCGPCHELDKATFSDRRVIARARNFAAFKVDLTRSDSPEAELWRKRFDVRGVPAVLFVAPGGAEVRAARVERFMTPEEFLPRLELAARGGLSARS